MTPSRFSASNNQLHYDGNQTPSTIRFQPTTTLNKRKLWTLRIVLISVLVTAATPCLTNPAHAQEAVADAEAKAVTTAVTVSADNNVTAAAMLPDLEERFSKWITIALNDPIQADAGMRLALSSSWTLLQHPEKSQSNLQAILKSDAHSATDKNLALRVLSILASQSGDQKKAVDLAEQSGCMPLWISGPWGKFVHANFDTVFDPEKKIDLAAAADKDTPGWIPVSVQSLNEPFEPWHRVWPNNAEVYAFTQCVLSTDTEALLWIDTACAAKIWLDGADTPLVVNRLEEESSVEQAWKLTLKAGNHHFLFKLHPVVPDHATSIRLTDMNGFALSSVNWDTTSKTLLPISVSPEEKTAKPESWPITFKRASDGSIAFDPEQLLAVKCYDQASEIIDRRMNSGEKIPVWKSLALRIALNNPNVPPLLRDRNADTLIQDLLKADLYPGHMAAIKRDIDQNRTQQALMKIDTLLKRWPKAAELHDLRCRMALDRKWHEQAALWIETMKKELPSAAQPYLHEATLAIELQDAGHCALAYAEARKHMPLDPRILVPQARAWQNAGNPDNAIKTLQEGLALIPDDPALLLELGKTQLLQNQTAEALATLQNATASYPRNPDFWQVLGDVQYRRGDKEAALKSYGCALDLAPERHNLRRLYCKLSGTAYDFWTRYAISAEEQLKNTANMKLPGTTARLIDQTVLEIYPDGSFANFTHELQKVLHPSGVTEAGKVRFAGELLLAQTLLPNGKTVEPMRLPNENSLTMPALSIGASVEYEYLHTADAPFDRSVRFPKWYFRSPDTKEAFLLSQYVIRVPKSYPFQFSAHNLSSQVQFSREEQDDWVIYTWTGKNMPRADHEEDSTDIDERLPFVEISGKRTWSDVNDILKNEYLGRTKPNVPILAHIKEHMPASHLVETLRQQVVDLIRTEGRYSNASHIMAAKRGDRNILLMALLKKGLTIAAPDYIFLMKHPPVPLGTTLIQNTAMRNSPVNLPYKIIYAACRPAESRLAAPDWTMPSADYFTDRIVGVEIDNAIRWLDTTTKNPSPIGVPKHLEGGTAFIIDDNGGRFLNLPSSEESQTQNRYKATFRITDNGIQMSGHRWVYDEEVSELEDLQKQPTYMKIQNFEDHMRLLFADVVTTKLVTNILADGSANQDYELESRLGGLTKEPGGALALRMPLLPLNLYPDKDENRRDTDFHRKAPQTALEGFYIHIPERMEVLSQPRTIILKSEFGSYRLCMRVENGDVLLEREYDFPALRILIGDWKDYMEFCRQIRQAETDPIRFKNR